MYKKGTKHAIQEGIVKWQGIADRLKGGDTILVSPREENLRCRVWTSTGEKVLCFASSCTLCALYNNQEQTSNFCEECPLPIMDNTCESSKSSWYDFMINHTYDTAMGMVKALKLALEGVNRDGEEE